MMETIASQTLAPRNRLNALPVFWTCDSLRSPGSSGWEACKGSVCWIHHFDA
jgi:hypothetical protein